MMDAKNAQSEAQLTDTVPKLTTAAKLGLMERDLREHAMALGSITSTLREVQATLKALEEWQLKAMMEEVRKEEQNKALMLRLDQMEETFNHHIKAVQNQISRLGGTWTKILWAAATPIIGTVAVAILVMAFGGVPKP